MFLVSGSGTLESDFAFCFFDGLPAGTFRETGGRKKDAKWFAIWPVKVSGAEGAVEEGERGVVGCFLNTSLMEGQACSGPHTIFVVQALLYVHTCCSLYASSTLTSCSQIFLFERMLHAALPNPSLVGWEEQVLVMRARPRTAQCLMHHDIGTI